MVQKLMKNEKIEFFENDKKNYTQKVENWWRIVYTLKNHKIRYHLLVKDKRIHIR